MQSRDHIALRNVRKVMVTAVKGVNVLLRLS